MCQNGFFTLQNICSTKVTSEPKIYDRNVRTMEPQWNLEVQSYLCAPLGDHTVKKRLAVFPSPAGMLLTKFSLAAE
jgi:hypothetical protein